jgi:hypothetical protein
MARWTKEQFEQHQGKGKRNKSRKPAGKGANQITAETLDMLNGAGQCFAWRNNTTGIFDSNIAISQIKRRMPHLRQSDINTLMSIMASSYRKHHGIKGQGDILGIDRLSGRFLSFEVKAGSDRLRPDQEQFIRDVIRSKGYATTVRSASEAFDKLVGSRKKTG